MEDFETSQLATREYWENYYRRDIGVYRETGDPGDSWFGEPASLRLVSYVARHWPTNTAVVDIGCGNGAVLRLLAERGFNDLTGLDFSPACIELAIASSRQPPHALITYRVDDITSEAGESTRRRFTVALDKGTYDAISLSPDRDASLASYRRRLEAMLCDDGAFALVSCNWTRGELAEQFAQVGLTVVDELAAPSISFGGKSGSTVTTVVIRRRESHTRS